MPTHHTPVAIVGAGPCGLITALLLARCQVPCVVFEKKSGLSTHPKAMGTSRRSAEIFRQLGILDQLYEPTRHLTDGGDAALNIFARSFVGEEWGRIPLTEMISPLSPGPSFHCPQTRTEQVLYDALNQAAPHCVRFHTEVTKVTPESDIVNFTAGNESWTADWLIAADGAGGQIRHELRVESDGPGDMGHFLNTYFRADYGARLPRRRSLLFTVLADDIIEFFVTVNGSDLWLMHHFLQPGETAEHFSPDRLAGLIRKASGLSEVPVEVISVSPWVMSPKVSRQFRSGRIFLVGDAAARMSPAGGLGLNTGLQSAHNLAWKLAAVARGEAAPALLDTYEEERRGEALWTLEHTNRNALEVYGIIQAAVRRDWAEVRKLIAENGRAGSRLGIDLGVEYTQGAFVADGTAPAPRSDPINDYSPNARPGARAPHFVMSDGRRSVLDLFGPRFTLLASESAPAAPPTCRLEIFPKESPFAATYGVQPGGCVLVRPDGYVGARWPTAPADGEVARALAEIVGR